ncbi:MAG: hypothetical protein KGM16_12245 [Bacteroidota bacterium]|nr:hypothetical protein [Bacteroidota bacterium]
MGKYILWILNGEKDLKLFLPEVGETISVNRLAKNELLSYTWFAINNVFFIGRFTVANA